MSQFTLLKGRPALYEPSRHNVRHPLTPPETDSDYGLPHVQPIVSAPAGIGIELESTLPHSTADIPPLHRKAPSVAYINSGVRESRDRVIQRSIKWLIMVMPPASFAREHGHLGSTLSSGPSRRLPQGILLPLHPTMGGQLGAIAREFSLPSIAGLCLYLNTVSAGTAVTPRVTDESWSLLWAQFLDTRNAAASQTQLPICGCIEFDVDLRKARWYDAWLSAPRRDARDITVPVTPSRRPTLSHWRGDSRASFPEAQGDDLETLSLLQQAKPTTVGRHVPRKLSLVDRFELSSIKSGSKLVTRNTSPPSPTEFMSHRQQPLSPIVQQDGLGSARRNLDQLITTWQEGASQIATPLAAMGQTSLDPANMPNTVSLNDLGLDIESFSPLNLDDFAWSVSSAGPPEHENELDPSDEWEYDPSVHLAHRLQGSVCMTPTTCTSLGPPDSDNFSSPSYLSRLASPDIARRILDDCPPTPSTCTSWGPMSNTNSSHRDEFETPSVHLANRGIYSRPVTPSTATTWGAMDSRPPSAIDDAYSEVARTADAACCSSCSSEYMPVPENHYDHWTLVWPYYHGQQIELPGVATQDRTTDDIDSSYRHPCLNILKASYPTLDLYPSLGASSNTERIINDVHLAVGYPTFDLYPAVYPHMDIYPTPALFVSSSSEIAECFPANSLQPISCKLSSTYPTFDLYPAVYPWNLTGLYPSITTTVLHGLHLRHPAIRVYAPVYPLNVYEIYLAQIVDQSSKDFAQLSPAQVILKSHHPVFDIYAPTYPHSSATVYHVTGSAPVLDESISVHLRSCYPTFSLYPALYPFNVEEIYPRNGLEEVSRFRAVDMLLPKTYSQLATLEVPSQRLSYIAPSPSPNPLVCLSDLQSIHALPEVQDASSASRGRVIITRLKSHYPVFNLYPSVYPGNAKEIYPSMLVDNITKHDANDGIELSVVLSVSYPGLELYAPLYPYNLEAIYPAVGTSEYKRPRIKRTLSSSNTVLYQPRGLRSHNKHASIPSMSMRHTEHIPPVPPLPQNLYQLRPISPWTGLPRVDDYVLKSQPNENTPRYPVICLYPAVYPHFSLYPILGEYNVVLTTKTVLSHRQYRREHPLLQIHHSVYPHFDLYPVCAATTPAVVPPLSAGPVASSRIPQKTRKYTHADLHIQVFGKTPPPSPRQLPTPPGGTVNIGVTSPRQIPPPRMLSGVRSGTVNRSLPSSIDGSPVRRQLPTPPGGVDSTISFASHSGRILSPRPYGLHGSPASKIPLPSPRLSPLSSPLAPVFELGIDASHSQQPSLQRHIPAQLNVEASLAYRSPGTMSASLPTIFTSPNEYASGLIRTMSVPPRPLPRARSGSIAMNYARAPLPPLPDLPHTGPVP